MSNWQSESFGTILALRELQSLKSQYEYRKNVTFMRNAVMQSSAVSDVDVCLDIFGQQPRLNIYTQLCLCFSLPEDFSHSLVINKLTSGLERLTAGFPWVAGQVICEESSHGNTGVFKIKPLNSIPGLIVRDLRNNHLVPTMRALRQANFPMKMLDESIIAPRNTFPGTEESKKVESNSPVLLVQVNFITGGLILTFLGQHQTMDIIGQGQIMRLFSKACHGEYFTDEELFSGNLDRQYIIPPLDKYKQGLELSRHLVRRIPSNTGESVQSPKCIWASFVFNATSLATLKAVASSTLSPNVSYISTDDALSAFIWQSIMRARSARLSPTTEATLGRAIDVRRHVGILPTYPGMIQNMTYTTFQLQHLVTLPVGEIASAMRRAVDPKTTVLPFRTRALATYMYGRADKSNVSPASSVDLSIDVLFSSWAKIDCYSLDFNLGLGLPEAVRRPKFQPLESFVYFMPKAPDGEIAVAICLRDEDMDRLKCDKEFANYARFDG
jgi:hypothetical protein